MSNFIDLEIIQTLPFSNANRDDVGQPKTVRVGGVARGRISSQSLKRAARLRNADRTTGLGLQGDTDGGEFYRTRYARDLITHRVLELGGTEEDVKKADTLFAKKSVLGELKKGNGADDSEKGDVLIVLTHEEVDALARNVLSGKLTERDIVEVLKNSAKRDIALWGRFFANSKEATLDGAAQVAHAFTTHAVNIEPDFFVGLDDGASLFSTHAGAGHPGENYYLTGTFYKYSNVNIEEAILNLLNARVEKKELHIDSSELGKIEELVDFMVEDFISSFVLSVPQGKIRSTAHQTLPALVRVTVRNNRPVNAATAFEKAIPLSDRDIPLASVRRLAEEHTELTRFVGEPTGSVVLATKAVADAAEPLGTLVDTLPDLVKNVKELIKPIVQAAIERYSK